LALERRVAQLEKGLAGPRRFHFLPVSVQDHETKEQAFRRALATANLRPEDVGLCWFAGYKFGFEIERRNGCTGYDLIGWDEFKRELLHATATSWRSSIRAILQKRPEADKLGLDPEL
jgi:hypothetical protein